ncbi:MAG: FtsX-like permease family protein [Deltaproteobacteria bacterium]|nr:FtsX-like permease family protein [Deltaproteobacteria bacterium]
MPARVVGTASLTLASTLVFSLVAVSSGVEAQLGVALRSYGANLVLLPRATALRFGHGALDLGPVEEERTLRATDLKALATAMPEGVDTLVPGLIASAQVRGQGIGAAGYPFDELKRLSPHWRVQPRWPRADDEAMVGSALAARLGLRAGETIAVTMGNRSARVVLAAEVETGGGEDDDLFLSLKLVQDLSGRPDAASLALVRARQGSRSAAAVAAALEAALPGVEARTFRQVAQAEEALLAKVKRLLWLVTLAVGAATAFTVAGTLGVLLLGRRQEIGLCLALGATARRVRLLLLAEAMVAGLAGGMAGCLCGILAAETITRSVFGVSAELAVAAPLLAVATGLVISLGAAAWPVHRALRVSPCDALRAP